MPEDPLFIDASAGAPAYSGRELRRAFAALLTQGVADRFGARSGLHPMDGTAATIAAMTVTVKDLKAVVYQAGVSLRGPYVVQLPQAALTVPTADPTNPRKDIIQVRVWDDTEDATGLRKADTEYKTGVPAPSPTEPAVDSGAFRLATVDVPAGSTAPTLTVNAPWTVAAGGVIPVRNAAELPSAGRYEGMAAWQQDTNRLVVWDGTSAWVPTGSYGLLGRAQVTAAQGTIAGTEVVLTGLSVAVTPGSNRRVRVVGKTEFNAATPPGNVALKIQRNGTNISQYTVQAYSATAAQSVGCVVEINDTPGAGTHTYRLVAQRVSSGGGDITSQADAAKPAFIDVYDAGQV